ncbi:transporter substrate-binding domain-containing protein [Ancylobacter sp. G4_0304]|uniref:transporter substrate-binding domain-containing protein n=1 Tax=Ancylobacter sp. G4_0304 TaxID=3114289 RepID=UPI0039C5E928
MRRSLIALSLAIVASTSLTAAARADIKSPVVIATEGAYAPWNLTDSAGKIVGFEPELIDYICKRAKLECTIVAQDWDGMIPGLIAGKSDVIMDAISITPEREQIIAFSNPYARTKAGFLTARDGKFAKADGTGSTLVTTPTLNNAADTLKSLRAKLSGASIGIQTGTVYAEFIEKNFGDIATIREYRTNDERNLDLENGRLDLAFEDTVVLMPTVEKANGALEFTGPAFGGTLFDAGSGFGFRKGDDELKAAFNAGIAAALADGTIKALGEKWLKADVSP